MRWTPFDGSATPSRWNPLARRRRRRARLDAALVALERAAVAAEAERARLTEAVAVSHRALLLLHDRLRDWADQPARAAAATARMEAAADAADARVRALLETARAELAAAAADVGRTAADRVSAELAPARRSAEEHAAYLRASLDRLRGQADTLAGAQAAAGALADLSALARAEVLDAADALGRRGIGR